VFARVSFYDLSADSGDIEAGFSATVDPLQRMEGERGVLLLVNDDDRKAITITFWDSRQALDDSAVAADELREEAARQGRLTIRTVEAYRVAIEERH
jgi:heme-degrading monooxygenase HmoA